MTTQPCNKCGCPVVWDKTIDKTYKKKDGSTGYGWWREDLSKEEHTRERCDHFNTNNEWRKVGGSQPITNPTLPQKTDYGKIPDWLLDEANGIKEAWQGYASLAAKIVDEFQPTLDARTRGMAVSATIDQIIEMQKIRAIKSLRSEKE